MTDQAKPGVTLNGQSSDWHYVPDTVIDDMDPEGLAVRGASMRGDANRRANAPRQDAMGVYRVSAGGIDAVVACVADGADDVPLSWLGAELVCLLVRDEVTSRLPQLFADPENVQKVCEDLVESLSARLVRRAGFLNVDPAALATALAVAVVETGAEAQERRIVRFSLGSCTFTGVQTKYIKFTNFQDILHAALTRPETIPDSKITVRAMAATRPSGYLGLLSSTGMIRAMQNEHFFNQVVLRWRESEVPDSLAFARQLASSWGEFGGEDRTAICIWAR